MLNYSMMTKYNNNNIMNYQHNILNYISLKHNELHVLSEHKVNHIRKIRRSTDLEI